MEEYFNGEEPSLLPIGDESLMPPTNVTNCDINQTTGENWDKYRAKNVTTTSVEDPTDGGDKSKMVDKIAEEESPKQPSQNKSIVSTFAKKAMGVEGNHFFTLKGYEDELKKARSDIFGLKLRIRLLEESQGLAEKPDDKENVYRVNLDLRVEKEVLKQQVDEKVSQLQEAYFAVDQLERERDEERQNLLGQIEDLKGRIRTNDDGSGNKVRLVENESLLLEAFGSMNLGARSEDDDTSRARNANELEKANEALKKEIEAATSDLIQAQSEINALKNELLSKTDELAKVMSTNEAMAREILTKSANLERVQNDNDRLGMDLIASNKAYGTLTAEYDSYKATSFPRGCEIHHKILMLNEWLSDRNSMIEQQQSIIEQKTAEIEQLDKKVSAFKDRCRVEGQTLAETRENLKKAQLCVTGLTEVTASQKDEMTKLEFEQTTYKAMFEQLKQEYEACKAKVRKYRSGERNRDWLNSNGDTRPWATEMEMEIAKKAFADFGAKKALSKAEKVCNERLGLMDFKHKSVIQMMQKRLEELANCIQKILAFGDLDQSVSGIVDESIRDLLEASLNESRRLSQSILAPDDPREWHQEPFEPIKLSHEDLDLNVSQIDDDYECLLQKTKREFEDHQFLIKDLYRQLEEAKVTRDHEVEKLQNDQEDMSTRMKDLEAKHAQDGSLIEAYEFQIAELRTKIRQLESDNTVAIAEKNASIEELRIKCGSSQEKARKMEDELAILRRKSKNIKEITCLRNEVAKLQSFNKEATEAKATLEAELKVRDKIQHDLDLKLKDSEEKLESTRCQLSDLLDKKKEDTEDTEDTEDVRKKLREAEEKLRKYRERQETVDKALRHQLAKTHVVLKKTRANLENVPENN